MAPAKSTRNALTNTKQATAIPKEILAPSTRKPMTRRGNALENIQQDQNMEIQTRGKRKAESSPMKNDKVKRSALSSLTNNFKLINNNNNNNNNNKNNAGVDDGNKKHNALKKKDINNIYSTTQQQTQTQVLQDIENIKIAPIINVTNTNNNIKINNSNNNVNSQKQMQTKIMTRAAAARNNSAMLDEINKVKTKTDSSNSSNILGTAQNNKVKKGDELVPPAAPLASHVNCPNIKLPYKTTRRISNEFNKTEDSSLYMSALEDISSSENTRISGNFERRSGINIEKIKTELIENEKKHHIAIEVEDSIDTPPDGVEDFDRKSWNDPFQVSQYAMDIFKYLKSREKEFIIDDYMPRQVNLSEWMRSLLVDWMVEVQETFELNHETLYLAVKIVDVYLSRVVIHKDKLQLLGAASLFIACKYDERTPPLVDDFLYICDGAYKHKELIHMEMEVLRTIDFDLGIPLSYRFLRRYARCGRVPLPTLTLARYILELSLMDYAVNGLSDSRMACAALFIALRMHGKIEPWTLTFEYYTEYKLKDFAFIVPILNETLQRKLKGSIKTIYSKYSHKIFHEVANVPHMSTEMLFKDNLTVKEIEKILTDFKCSIK